MTARWSLADRAADLERAARDGVELLVIGGGITGAGVLRDAASRGLRTLLVERDDFASGTSSRSSKMVHGGMRYIGEGHLGVTRNSLRERDLLLSLAPHLVRRVPFLFPAWEDSKRPLWQVRAALWIYAGLANFRRTSRFDMLRPEEISKWSRDLRTDGLRGAGLFHDAQVDDARLVLETLKDARVLGGAAANHAEVVGFLHADDAAGRVVGVRVRDALADRTFELRAGAVVNAAGPAVERVRGLDRPVASPELRPAKGIHLVIPRDRVHCECNVTFYGPDGRHLFLAPWGDAAILGTTDSFSDEIDEPVVTIEEVHYLLGAANAAFPQVGLTTNDLRSVYAGVRPLAAEAGEETPPSSVSREERFYEDESGLLSVAGGKLTTYRATGEKIVDRLVKRLPAERRRALGRSRTAERPLRVDDFDPAELATALERRFEVAPSQAERLVLTHGSAAEDLLAAAPPERRLPIGGSQYTFAEIPFVFETECPASLCDLLERRLRIAIFAVGQGLPDLARIAEVAAEAAGWDSERARAEAIAYADAVRRSYQIVAPRRERTAA